MLGTILVTEGLKNYGMWKGTMQSGIRTVWDSSQALGAQYLSVDSAC